MEYEVGRYSTTTLLVVTFFFVRGFLIFEDTYVPKVGTYLASELFLSHSLMQ